MENQPEKQEEISAEKFEQDNKKPPDIESIETIQPSHKVNNNFDKKKNFHQNKNYFNFNNHNNYYQGYNNYSSNYNNPNTMGKNRTNSEKYNKGRYQGQNFNKNTYNDQRNKIHKFNPKKKFQDPYHNNDHNHSRMSDEKLEFVNPYVEAENMDNYHDFAKLPNLNFLKQNSKQKRFLEDSDKESKNNLGQNNSFLNIKNQNLLNLNLLNQINQGNNAMNPFNIFNNPKSGQLKQIMNNLMTNNVQNTNKLTKNNNQFLLNNILNLPLNLNNLNNNIGLQNLNAGKIGSLNNINNSLNNINNPSMLLNPFLQSNQMKNFALQQKQHNANNKMPMQIPNQQLDTNKSPQKINHMNNQNIINDTNNINNSNNNLNTAEKVNTSMNLLVQAYIKTLQCQQTILNKMTQLFNPSNNSSNIHTDIQLTVNQLKNSLNNEMNQISNYPGINMSNLSTSVYKTSSNESNDNKENKNINENKGNNENDKSDKYIQNILSTWPEQKFYKPYSPLLKLEKSQSLLKPSSYLNNSIFANPTLNINTISMSNQSILLVDPNYKKKDVYDDQKIDELLKIGKCVTGVLRMNNSHNHGYITVKGIDNDILIKGKNLYEYLNLDEVVIELLDFNKWKNFTNKKGRKFSYMNDDSVINNIPNQINGDFFKTKEDRLNYINKKMKDLRPEGKAIKVLKSPNKEKQQICTIQIEKNKIYAVPIDDTIPRILINIKNLSKKLIPNIDSNPNKFFLTYFSNDFEKDYKNYKTKYFFVKIHSFVFCNIFQGPIGYIVNEIGSSGNIDVESEVLLNLNNVNYSDKFSDDIMNEVSKKLNEVKITDEYIKSTNRQDFRNELVFTIDPYTSKDLDDAIHVKVIDEKTKLLEIGVHIADPTTYIDVDSLLDKEALNRATSVYLVQKKISMLPLILSDDVCSIMPGKDTLTISCVFRIYLNNGSLDETFTPYFTLSVVNSRAKWDYDLVQKLIEKKEVKYDDLKFEDGSKPQSEEIFNGLKDSVEILYQLTKLVRKERFDSGSLMIEQEGDEFDLDPETKMPINFHISHKNEAHSLVEELMLISNLLCAKHLYSNTKKYALIRRHPFFNEKNYAEIQRYLSVNKIYTRNFDDMIELNKILKKIHEENINQYTCVQQKLKFTLLRAEYVFAGKFNLDDLRHSSLNYDLYTHFTSPIRRYPDMIVHRQLKEIFKYANSKPEKSAFKKFEKYISYMEHINKRYNSARIISHKSKRLFKCLYLKTAPKKLYTALIMDINFVNNNKKTNNNNNLGINYLNNWNNNNSNNSNTNSEEDETTLMLYVPELNLELEWKKSDNKEIVFSKADRDKNEYYIEYKHVENGIQNKSLKNFDSLQVELFSVDSIPIDARCRIDLTK